MKALILYPILMLAALAGCSSEPAPIHAPPRGAIQPKLTTTEPAEEPNAHQARRVDFIFDARRALEVAEIAQKYGAPDKSVTNESWIWQCADGGVLVRAYNHLDIVPLGDGTYRREYDYRVLSVSVWPTQNR